MNAKSSKQIIKQIGCPHLNLYRGEGYWYFIYDNLSNGGVYDSHSVYVMRLNDMGLDRWVDEGKAFVKKVEGQS